FYLFTIFHATKYLNVRKYKYAQRSTGTVKNRYNEEKDFKLEEARDLIYIIEKNTLVNNHKAGNLIYAYRSFRIANVLVGVLALFLVASIYFVKKDDDIKTVNIANPVNVKALD